MTSVQPWKKQPEYDSGWILLLDRLGLEVPQTNIAPEK